MKFMYGLNIWIHGVRTHIGGGLHNSKPMGSNADAIEYAKKVAGQLDELKKFKTGALILNSIGEQSPKMVHILDSDNRITFDAGTNAYPLNTQSKYDCLVRPFRPPHLNMPSNKSAGQGSYKEALEGIGVKTDISDTAPELANILLRATRKGLNRNAIATRAGITTQQLGRMEQGLEEIDDKVYWKLVFLLYDFLKPGPGCSTYIRFNAMNALTTNDAKHKYNPKKNWNDVPAFVALGHELIHAWRMMAGKRLVLEGYEEEAMTTGCGPFSNLAMTENALRADVGLPNRPQYEGCISTSANMAQDWKNDCDRLKALALAVKPKTSIGKKISSAFSSLKK